MLEGLFAKKMRDDTLQLKEQFAKEREEVEASELEEIDFSLTYSKLMSNVNIYAVVCIIIMAFQILAKPILKHYIYDEPFVIDDFLIVLLVALGALLFFAIVYFAMIWTKRIIHVKKSVVYYGKKSWHYKEISKIVVNKMNIASVYSYGKKIFWISAEFNNFEKLLSWAEKCHIPVERKIDIVNKELPTNKNGDIQIPTKYAIIIIIIAFLGFFILLPLRVLIDLNLLIAIL